MAGESKQIYQLTTKEFEGNVLVPFDTPNTDPSTQAEKPYVSGKASGNAVADFIANTEEYTTDLDTTAKTITGAINELKSEKADNTTNTITGTYNINIGSSNMATAVTFGKILIVSGYFMPTSNVSANTTIATFTGVKATLVAFASSFGSNGSKTARLKIQSSGNNTVLVVESALDANEYYSYTIVSTLP